MAIKEFEFKLLRPIPKNSFRRSKNEVENHLDGSQFLLKVSESIV